MRGVAESTQEEPLFVRFEVHPKQDADESKKQGRPIFKDTEYIRIRVPGDKLTEIHRPVREDDKQRFGAQYRKFQEGTQDQVSGTPLKEWPLCSRSQVEELTHFGIRTVEQLAATSDGNLQSVGHYLALRQKARDFLEKAKGNAPLEKMRSELEERDNAIAALKQQMKEMAEALQAKGKGK